MSRLVWRFAISVGLTAAVIAVCLRLAYVDHATVALLLVLVNVGLARFWGRAEALTAVVAGGIAFDYYFVPPRGFTIAYPEHWAALAAFLVTAVVTGQLAAQSERRRIQAVDRQDEMEKMYRLVNALLESDSAASTVAQLADKLAEIFGADGVAVYDKHTGLIVRSGRAAGAVSDESLRTALTAEGQRKDAVSPFSLVPIRHGSELVGSVGISGGRFSESLLRGVAGRLGLGLARMYAMERTTEAEIVRRSEELKSAVLDAMAHEIKNPLNSIKLAATTLLTSPALNEPYKQEMLSIIGEEATRMDLLIDEAAHLARLDADELSLQKEPQDVAHLIPAAIAEMAALARHRRIQVSIPDSLPPAECDGVLIARVLKQLLSNALKYSPDGSPLTVSVQFIEGAIVIGVVDLGPGVAVEDRDHIFEKYYRGRAVSSSTPGTGLGLASARSIVQAHGGKIWVTSPPGGGAAFHFSLPVMCAGNDEAARSLVQKVTLSRADLS